MKIRSLIYRSKILKLILASLFQLFYFFNNKKKIKIYFNNNFWLHECFAGKFANMHPVMKVEHHLLHLLPIHYKYYKPKLNDVIFDIGAGTGENLIYSSKLIGQKGKIFAIEPNIKIYSYLLETIKINNLKNIIPLNIAIYDESEKNINFNSNVFNWLGGKIDEKGNLTVKTKTLDQIVLDFNIKKINFAKFNIEGAEKYLPINGNLFNKICQNYCISCHDFLKKNDYKTYNDIYNFLKKSSFKFLKGNKTNVDYLDYYIYATKDNLFKTDTVDFDIYDYYNFYNLTINNNFKS